MWSALAPAPFKINRCARNFVGIFLAYDDTFVMIMSDVPVHKHQVLWCTKSDRTILKYMYHHLWPIFRQAVDKVLCARTPLWGHVLIINQWYKSVGHPCHGAKTRQLKERCDYGWYQWLKSNAQQTYCGFSQRGVWVSFGYLVGVVLARGVSGCLLDTLWTWS